MNQTNTLVFAHIGDLHLTREKEQNHLDFLAIVSQLATEFGSTLDFVLLPGDNADNGRPEQYALITAALRMLQVPVFILSGDHDMEQGSLNNLYAVPAARTLPFSETIKGYRCLFLDVCGPGAGGPDFRLGKSQLQWLEEKLRESSSQDHPVLLFMHTYPDDLKDEAEKKTLLQLISGYDVFLVDMGHTHYNEIANDGRTIYTATRSTGQIDEGPVGYSLVTIDQGIVSWRFKALADPFPYVVITSPSDHRLARSQSLIDEPSHIRALVFGGHPVDTVALTTGRNVWQPMALDPTQNCYSANPSSGSPPSGTITVRAIDQRGRPGLHSIIPVSSERPAVINPASGSDRAAIGPWPENGISGTQLGPNRNAKPPHHK